MRFPCPGPACAGVALLLVLALGGCAGGGSPGGAMEDEVPETVDSEEDDYLQAWEARDVDALRRMFDPVGPDPAGPDSLLVGWSEPSGPTEEGRPLDWVDRQTEEFDLAFTETWESVFELTPNLVFTGSVMGAGAGPADGFWRLGVHFNEALRDGTWLSVGLYGGESFRGVDGSVGNGVFEFGMDLHFRGRLAVYDDGKRAFWVFGVRRGFNRWGSGIQAEYGCGYGGLGIDLPLGQRTFLMIQGTLGIRWFEDYDWSTALEAGVDVGVVIPLSGPDNTK